MYSNATPWDLCIAEVVQLVLLYRNADSIVCSSPVTNAALLVCDPLNKAMCADDDITLVSRVEATLQGTAGSKSLRSRRLKDTLSEAGAAHQVGYFRFHGRILRRIPTVESHNKTCAVLYPFGQRLVG